MDGILLVNKPKGWTSFDVVAKVRGELRRAGSKEQGAKKIRVGHTGTLDPLATGLLVLLIGSYTKRAAEFSKLDKIYEVTMKLGQTSTTGDEEGQKRHISDQKPSPEAIRDALEHFRGDIMQKPPKYSAVKINGQRAYKLARAGKEVETEARKVTIYDITEVEYRYPEVKFTAKVSSGTYIRSLVEDIGQELGTGAYLTDLNRTQVGEYLLKNAVGVKNIDTDDIKISTQI